MTGIVRAFACGLFTAWAVSFLTGGNCAPQVICTLMGNCPSTTPTPTISPGGVSEAGIGVLSDQPSARWAPIP